MNSSKTLKKVSNGNRMSDAINLVRVGMLMALLAGMGLHAQETSARLTGVATDATGAAIPNATIVLTNELTKAEVTHTATNERGEFSALQLPPGTYIITVRSAGFKAFTLTDVQLTIAQALDLPITLETGAVTETITIAASDQLQLENGNTMISTAISPQQVTDLPLPNRDLTQLFSLVPGVIQGGDPTSYSSAQLSINGSRTLNTEVLLDGSSVINGSTGNLNRLPSPDFISDFRVIGSTAPAEYGRTSGAVISIGSRSGTSLLHGTAYELFQNNVLNANAFFNKMQLVTVPRAKDNYNQVGFALGGPVVIPFLYNGRQKTFFFVNYDQTINRNSGTTTLTIPAGPTAQGDFSSISTAILDPKTGIKFPGNIIPANRIDPAAARIIAALPAEAATNNNYFTQQSLVRITPIYSARLDHQVGDKIRLFGSVTRQINGNPQVVAISNALNTSYANDADQGWEGALGYTQQLSPTLVMNLGFGVSRDGDVRIPTSLGLNPTTTFGIGTAPAQLTPQINITNYASLGTVASAYSKTYSNQFTYFGSLTKVIGVHTLKVGGAFRKNQLNIFNPGVQIGGTYSFTGDISSKGSGVNSQYNSLADFLLGAVKTSAYGLAQPETGRRNYNIGAYGQDEYRLTSKITLNAGVRWEYEAPLVIASNNYSRIDPATGKLLIAGQNATDSLNITTPKLNFAPRVGLIWSAHPTTVVRAAYGTYYGLVFGNLGGQVGYPGYENNQSFNNLGTGIAQPFTLSQGMPLIGIPGSSNPNAAILAGTVSSPYSVTSSSFGSVNPLSLTQQWNLGLQQQFVGNIVLELNYVGLHGVHNPLLLPENLPDPNQANAIVLANTTTATQQARPFPTITTLPVIYNVGGSSYNALQSTLRRRFKSGLSFSTSYTWGHSIDDGSGVYNYSLPNGLNGGQYPSDPTFRKTRDRGNSSFDVRSSFTGNASYTTKGPIWLRNLLISASSTARTGLPLNIVQTNEFPGVANPSFQRPNGIGAGLKIPRYNNGTAVQYLAPPPGLNTPNPAFPLSPSGPLATGTGTARKLVVSANGISGLGTLGRNVVYGPDLVNINASVARTFTIYDRVKFLFRVDAFNVMNHTNFLAPNSSLTVNTGTPTGAAAPIGYFTGTFGQITSAYRPRFMQIVTRINF